MLRLRPTALALLVSVSACGIGACGGGSGTTDEPGLDGGDEAALDGGDDSLADTGSDSGAVDTGTTEDASEVGDDTAADTGGDSGGGETADDGGADTASTDTTGDTGTGDTGAADTSAETGATDSGAVDTGTDTGPDPCGALACTLDSDGDGIPDSVEGRCAATPTDTDGDGTPDYLDTDSDGDGIPDKVEWAAGGCDPTAALNDADGDGVPNFRDLDSDGNGLPDKDEACPPVGMPGRPVGCSGATPSDFDGDGVPDFLDPDNDHDSASTDKTVGLDDKFELTNGAGTYVGLVDTDGDGVPDLWDRDADGDGIFDLEDGLGDPDKDGKRNFQDVDSDGDGVGDKCEGTVDTDGDGKADYLDIDSDGDLLLDKDEDKDFDCVVDTNETSRIKKDTDGDGIDDLIETTLIGVAGAKDPALTPAKAGKFYFVVPYSFDGSAKPTPTSSPLALSTALNKGDVGFVIDRSGSMAGEIANLRTSLSTTIIPALKTRIPDLAVGVSAFVEYPVSPHTSSGDFSVVRPYYYINGTNGFVTTITANSQAAVNSLTTQGNLDWPESDVPAMYKALTGAALTWPGTVGTADPTPNARTADVPPTGTFGALHFRKDALTVLVNITDAPMHNGKRALNKAPTGVSGDYDTALRHSYASTVAGAPDVDQVITELNKIGGKFIGVGSDDGGRPLADDTYPYAHQAYIADKTGSYVPPTAFTGGTTQCKTGLSGANVTPDGLTVGGVKNCRLVFSIAADGTGLSTSIVDGVIAMLNTIKFDVYVEAYNDAAETTDVVTNFMEKVDPQPTGGTDPVSGATCEVFSATVLADKRKTPKAVLGAGDIKETITGLNPGKFYCYSVVPKANTVIAATSGVQTFKAWLRVWAEKPGSSLILGSDREVLFIVPPLVN